MKNRFDLKDPETKHRMKIMLICVAILFGSIFLSKLFLGLKAKYMMSQRSNTTPVSVMQVGYAAWQPKVIASGSLRAIRGVNVTTQLAGMVDGIYFTPGAMVQQGAVLVQLNAATELGQLQSLQAQAELAKITYNRDVKQYAVKAISKQVLDTDFQNVRNYDGQVAQAAATLAKKTITAPFSGRLGIRNVNLGQYLNAGDMIVTLQNLDPIWADFYVPQQTLSQLKVGMPVSVISDTYPGKKFMGKITTINPAVDVNTRNVEVEATVSNPDLELTPGMFATVEVETGKPQSYLTLPQTAISYNPYGDIVYIVQEKGKDKKNKPILIANQSFVVTGETRGDQVMIEKGLKGGETIVTSGQLKLKNGSLVTINNSIVPANNPSPNLPNSH